MTKEQKKRFVEKVENRINNLGDTQSKALAFMIINENLLQLASDTLQAIKYKDSLKKQTNEWEIKRSQKIIQQKEKLSEMVTKYKAKLIPWSDEYYLTPDKKVISPLARFCRVTEKNNKLYIHYRYKNEPRKILMNKVYNKMFIETQETQETKHKKGET